MNGRSILRTDEFALIDILKTVCLISVLQVLSFFNMRTFEVRTIHRKLSVDRMRRWWAADTPPTHNIGRLIVVLIAFLNSIKPFRPPTECRPQQRILFWYGDFIYIFQQQKQFVVVPHQLLFVNEYITALKLNFPRICRCRPFLISPRDTAHSAQKSSEQNLSVEQINDCLSICQTGHWPHRANESAFQLYQTCTCLCCVQWTWKLSRKTHYNVWLCGVRNARIFAGVSPTHVSWKRINLKCMQQSHHTRLTRRMNHKFEHQFNGHALTCHIVNCHRPFGYVFNLQDQIQKHNCSIRRLFFFAVYLHWHRVIKWLYHTTHTQCHQMRWTLSMHCSVQTAHILLKIFHLNFGIIRSFFSSSRPLVFSWICYAAYVSRFFHHSDLRNNWKRTLKKPDKASRR